MIRLVVTDLDGTLLAPDGTIPDANVEAIREAHSAGWAVAVAMTEAEPRPSASQSPP